MLKTVFYSLAALVHKILSLPLENKIHIFAPPCNILYLQTPPKIDKKSRLMLKSHLFKFSIFRFIPRCHRTKLFTVHRKEKRITKLNIVFTPSREKKMETAKSLLLYPRRKKYSLMKYFQTKAYSQL